MDVEGYSLPGGRGFLGTQPLSISKATVVHKKIKQFLIATFNVLNG